MVGDLSAGLAVAEGFPAMRREAARFAHGGGAAYANVMVWTAVTFQLGVLGGTGVLTAAVANRALEAGAFARFEDTATFKARVERDLANWTELVKVAGIKPD